MSVKNSLNSQDWTEWIIQTGIYSIAIPVVLVFLTSLQNGIDFKAAATAATYALLSALVNLLGKFQSGGSGVQSPQVDKPTNPPTDVQQATTVPTD